MFPGVAYEAGDYKIKHQLAIKFLPNHVVVNSDDRKRREIEAQAAPGDSGIRFCEETRN